MMGASAKPPTSLEDYERRIRDLRTVEQWLQFNLNVLRNTIQTMEIQKGTLQALESFRDSMMEMGQTASESAFKFPDLSAFTARAPEPASPPADEPAAAETPPESTDPVMQQAGWWWQTMQDQFSNLVKAAQAPELQAAMGMGPKSEATAAGSDAGESDAAEPAPSTAASRRSRAKATPSADPDARKSGGSTGARRR